MHLLVLLALLGALDAPVFRFDRTPEAVTFENGGVHLSGVLVKPPGVGPFPAVVLLHGAGPATHDDPAFVVHANAFLKRGFAVLTYDKRGSGASTGSLAESDYEDLARDAAAAVSLLRSRTDIQPSHIGLLGRSEGSWVATIAAAHDPSIAFVVMSSGAAVPAAEEVLYWTRRSLQAKGMSGERIDRAIALKKAMWQYYRDVVAGRATAEMREALLRRLPEFQDAHPEIPSKVMEPGVDRPEKFVAFVHMIDFDPAPLLATSRVPIMEVIGSNDDVVDPASTIAVMNELRARGKDATVLTLPGVDHTLLVMDHGRIVGYPPNYLDSVLNWATVRVGRRSGSGHARTWS